MNKRCLPLVVILVGAALRLPFLTSNPLWYDEAYTAMISRLPFDRLILATAGDVHPPLYYLLTSLMVRLPLSPEFALRSLSVIFSILALWFFWRLSGLLEMPWRARLLALAILAVLPVEIHYAQEGRMYALLQALVLAQWCLMLKREWRGLTLVSALMLYTHNYAMFYVGIVYLVGALLQWQAARYAGLSISQAGLLAPVISGLVAGLLYLPWFIGSTLAQMGDVADGYWIEPVTFSSVLTALFHITWGDKMPTWIAFIAGPTLGMLTAAALAGGLQNRRFGLLALAFGPLLAAVLISLAWHPILLFRGLFGSIPALALILAEAAFSRRAGFWYVPGAVVVAISLGCLLYNNTQGIAKEQDHTVLAIQGSSSVMVHLNDITLMNYTVDRPDLAHYLLDTGCPAGPTALSPQTHAAMGIQMIRRVDLHPGQLFAASINGSATLCEEQLLSEIARQSRPLAVETHAVGMNGVWQIGD